MHKIIALTDYKGNFGSKHDDIPYRSGMDKHKLKKYFKAFDLDLDFVPFSKIDLNKEDYKDINILYTSSEDPDYHYKDYIEDVVFALQLAGARTIPCYKFLRANNNKVFMEYLREISLPDNLHSLKTVKLGTLDEVKRQADQITFPVVVKGSQGASGTSVYLAKNKPDLMKKIKKVSKTFDLKSYLWELGRGYKHKGYIKNSNFRKKYILQEFVPNLEKDWKVLVFGERYFVLTRYTRENDFRASGSKTNYKAGTASELTSQILDFAKEIFESLDIPHMSLDIAFDGTKYHLIEMQGVYFGTSTINMSDAYFMHDGISWVPKDIDLDLEKIYADSIINFLNKQ